MRAVFDAGTYFPDRPPTWLEVGITLLVTGTVAEKVLRGDVVSWPALWAGFAVFAVALGPASQSTLGARIGQWFRGLDGFTRGAAIVLFVAGFALLSRFAWFPDALLSDFGSGGLLAAVCYMVVYVAWAGGVSGWTSGGADGP
ncbi:hypothetical protein NDI56_13265 [Haloarcula sp. S1CR25-12]|uniref:Uncharacterized protein n=1 Tax=Haloarcula saliterrae TaxID=2950534 RepID=A0ABU2FDM5_9EURY|nr:hypothetical protein [Haloarcula sp. S1CR25-12]MDS0260367.1 hypothetical protein [Haloarcula sp. S1CR25-12]